MVEPPRQPLPVMSPRKRARNVEEDNASKRLRKASYSADMANDRSQLSHNTAHPARAHPAQRHAHAVCAQQVHWLRNADQHLRITSLPNIVQVPGIPLDQDLATAKTPTLRPAMVFGLRSLTSAQRFYHYMILCVHGRDMGQRFNSGQDVTLQWKLICDLSNSLMRKEDTWHLSFYHDRTGQIRLEQIKIEQAVPVKLSSVDIQKAVPAPSSIHPVLSTAEDHIDSPIVLNSGIPSPKSNRSPETSVTSARREEEGVSRPPVRVKRHLEVPEETEEQRAARKKPRTEQEDDADKALAERIDNDLNQYNMNEAAVNNYWELKRRDRRDPWFVKWATYKIDHGIAESLKSSGQSSPEQGNTDAKLHKTLSGTCGGTSPDDIQSWRARYQGVRPDERKHPKDKVPVPDYPREDTVKNSTLREDGRYECQHQHKGNHACCKKGLDAAAKSKSCQKAVRAFHIEVEKLIISGNLHISHKDWDFWYSKKITDQKEKDRIDVLLQAVERPLRWSTQRHEQNSQPLKTPAVGLIKSPQFQVALSEESHSSGLATQVPAIRQFSRVGRALDNQTLPDDGLASSGPHLPSQATSQELKWNSAQKAAVTTVAVTTMAVTMDSRSRDPEKAMPATPKPASVVEQELRKAVREAVVQQTKQSEPVFIGGIDISKESYSEDPYWVIEKIIRLMEEKAKEDDEVVIEASVDNADLNSLFDDDPATMAVEEGNLPEDKVTPNEVEAPPAQSDAGSSTSFSQKPTTTREEYSTQNMLAVSQISAAEELYKSLLIDGEPCREFVDIFSGERFERSETSVLESSQENGGADGGASQSMTLAEEHALWCRRNKAVVDTTSFDSFQQAKETFEKLYPEEYDNLL